MNLTIANSTASNSPPRMGRPRRRILAGELGVPLSPAPSPVPSLRRLRLDDALKATAQPQENDLVMRFSGLSDACKISTLRALLDTCPREVLVEAQAHIVPKLRHDPFRMLPIELSLRILSYIKDPKSLAAASQVSRLWYILLNDDSTWKALCEAHHFRRLSAAGNQIRRWRCPSLAMVVPESAIVDSPSPPPTQQDVAAAMANSHLQQTRQPKYEDEHLANIEEALYIPEATRATAPTNYRSHFRQQYLLSNAWEHGGKLAARYSMRNPTSQGRSDGTSNDSLSGDSNAAAMGLPSVIVTTLVMSDRYVVLALDTSRILVFAIDGELLQLLCGHVMGVWALALEGDTLVSGGCDRDVRHWNLRTGACRQILRGHSSTVRCLAMAGEGVAISGGRDANVVIWDLDNGKALHRLVGHTGAVRRLETTEGKRVLSASYDCTVRIWNWETGELLHTLTGHFNQIYSLAVDGPTVATGSLDHTIRIWDINTGECRAVLQGHSALVGQLQLKGSQLVSGGSDGAVRVWNLDTKQCVHRIAAHDNSVTCLQADDERIVTGGPDGRINVWSKRSGEHIRELRGSPATNVWGVALRDDRVFMVYAEEDATVVELLSFVPE